jgi:diacylglycerol kinase (ATP)
MFLSNCITGRDQPKFFVRNARRNVKPYVIVNRRAGSVTDLDELLSQLQRLEPAALRVTRRRGDAEKFAHEAVRKKCGYVVAAGGDGTLNEVINGIAKHARQVRLGLVPLGTGNDFARSLQLPLDVEENIDILLARKSMAIDLVRVQSDHTRYFVNVAAGGFSGDVADKLTTKIKQAWGPLAYLRSAAAALPKLHAYKTEIVFDEEERLTIDLYNVVIGNGRFVAGGLPIAPKADPADGQHDVNLIPKRPGPEMALLAAEIVLGNHLSNSAVIFRRVKKIAVRSRPGMWFNVDGELVGQAPAVFQIIPGALNFIMSKR